jgi:two-component system, sporulation sensor kinase E
MMHKLWTYESQLHLGLMAIIIVLLLLCTASEFVLYRQRGVERSRVERSLNDLSATAAKRLEVQSGVIPNLERIELTRLQLNLTTLSVMPRHISLDSAKLWLKDDTYSSLLRKGLAGPKSQMVLSERIGEMQTGDSAEFLLMNQFASASGVVLLVAGAQYPEYDLLIQASDILFYSSLAGLLVLGLLYFSVTRVITAPFERLKRNAERTGRFDKEGADIDSIISDYENLVAELQERERELKALSELNQQKADNLENFSHYLMKSLDSGVITLDEEGKILSVNQAARDLLGLERGEWVSRYISELPRYCDPINEMVRGVSQVGNNEPYRELSIATGTPERSLIGVTVSAVYDANNSRIGFSVLLYDLREISRLRVELQKREQLAALGEMSGGLAHQLRNALGSARGYSRLVEKKIQAGADCADSLEKLGEELSQTDQLVSRFLDFARPLHVIRESINLEQFVSEIVEGFKVREISRVIRFDVHSDESAEVFADTLMIKQAITNVLENAIKSYQGEPGRVVIAVQKNSDRIVIEISDEGEGIEQENLDKVFLPFFTTRTDGSGLGLALAKKIVDLHNGQLTVQSRRGKGTTVKIILSMSGTRQRLSSVSAIS